MNSYSVVKWEEERTFLFVSKWYEIKAKVFTCGTFFSNGVHTFTASMMLCITSLGLQYLYREYIQLYDLQINSSKHRQKFSGYLNVTKWMHLKKQWVSILWILGSLVSVSCSGTAALTEYFHRTMGNFVSVLRVYMNHIIWYLHCLHQTGKETEEKRSLIKFPW